MAGPLQNHQPVLQRIAQSDTLPEDASWPSVRDEIKAALEKNIAAFLAQKPSTVWPVFPADRQNTANGGFKIPPFPPRNNNRPGALPVPLSRMTQEQADDLKSALFTLLDDLDAGPPFTIQRICELCLFPQAHYKTVGKYLRAVERALLVTSTWEDHRAMPTDQEQSTVSYSRHFSSTEPESIPSTPLFSPIPFLHEDARRSLSVSPPPSPLTLSASGPSSGGHPDAIEVKPLGMVDEMDDPSPGHMSDHPTPISSVTTPTTMTPETQQTLQDRFTNAVGGDEQDNAMDEDKENVKR